MLHQKAAKAIFLIIAATIAAAGLTTAPARGAGSLTIYLPFVQGGGGADPRASWLSYVNYHRSLAKLPPVAEQTAWSAGALSHARYVVKTDQVVHNEDPASPWYSAEGAQAGASGNVTGHFDVTATDIWAIDSWMQAPFHALGLLDPALARVGYGSYREADGDIQMGATIDVIRGLAAIPPEVSFPVLWPGAGATVPLARHEGEYPSPLSSCPGYTLPSGLPIIVQVGAGQLVPAVTAHSLTRGGVALEHCVFDESSYVNSDGAAQQLGRQILGSRDAVVIIPRSPLTPGASYTVSLTVSGETHTWSFTVDAAAQ